MLYLKNTSDAEDAWFITVTRNLTDSETKKSSVGSPWSYFVTFYVNILCWFERGSERNCERGFSKCTGLKQSEQDIIGQTEMIQDKGIEVYAPDILAIDDQYLVFGNLRGLIVYDLISKKVVGTIDTQAIGSIYFDGDKKQTHVIKNKNMITIFNSNKGIPYGE